MQSRTSRDLGDTLVIAVLLFVALRTASLVWPSFGSFLWMGHSFLFALAYLVLRAELMILRDEVYDRAERLSPRRPRPTAHLP